MSQLPQQSRIFVETIPFGSWVDDPDSTLQSIDLWKIYIPAYLHKMDQLFDLLSSDEKSRAARYHQQKDKHRFVVGRGMLRQILSHYTGCPSRGLELRKGINGKPYIHQSIPLEFNLSYSYNYILVGIASEAIGVDVEYINPMFDYDLLLDACFMNAEIQAITTSAQPREQFFKFWTRKEALLKATALGLGDYLTDFSCLDGTQSLPENLARAGSWLIESFTLDHAYWVSIAKKSHCRHRFIDTSEIFK
jgi:4'-phosphopantetheinyl transferase